MVYMVSLALSEQIVKVLGVSIQELFRQTSLKLSVQRGEGIGVEAIP